jgi:hypothetical protein
MVPETLPFDAGAQYEVAGALLVEALDLGAFAGSEHARFRLLVRHQRERYAENASWKSGVFAEAVTCLLPDLPWNDRWSADVFARLADAVHQQQPPEPPDLHTVTLAQAAGLVQRSKRTLQKCLHKLPPPTIRGRKGQPHEWRWSTLRPALEALFDRKLPERVPADRLNS